MESMTGYTCTPCLGAFTFPGIDTMQIEEADAFSVYSGRYTVYNVERQVFTPNITCLIRAGIEPRPRIEPRAAMYQADVLTTTLPRL